MLLDIFFKINNPTEEHIPLHLGKIIVKLGIT